MKMIELFEYTVDGFVIQNSASMITPAGEVIPCDFAGHSDTVVHWMEVNDPDTLAQWINDGIVGWTAVNGHKTVSDEQKVMEAAILHGWVRYYFSGKVNDWDEFILRYVRNARYLVGFTCSPSHLNGNTATACFRLLTNLQKMQPIAVELGGYTESSYSVVPYRKAVEFFRSI
jgi:hypothetical protein